MQREPGALRSISWLVKNDGWFGVFKTRAWINPDVRPPSLPHMLVHQRIERLVEFIGVQGVAIAQNDGAAIAAEVAIITVFKSGQVPSWPQACDKILPPTCPHIESCG